MKLGICTIQRNRGRWLAEWVAFHYLMGFRNFYIYLHKCTDNSADVIQALSKKFNIQCFVIPDDTFRPQLVSYQHAYQEFGHQVDWMAFIDGDEFLFPTQAENLPSVLENYSYEKMSALGVWWSCFGSGGHIQEPEGLIILNYQHRPPENFPDNSHIKSIVRGRQGSHFSVGPNAHIFNTIHGTKDENLRDIDGGFMPNLAPTYNHIRINHYVCQSYQYFKEFKQNSGAADAGALAVRPDAWWEKHDRNDEEDQTIQKFVPQLTQLLSEIEN
jgi:Glycosyltransferase family 92